MDVLSPPMLNGVSRQPIPPHANRSSDAQRRGGCGRALSSRPGSCSAVDRDGYVLLGVVLRVERDESAVKARIRSRVIPMRAHPGPCRTHER
jgi:hypothetical protein